MVRTNGVERWSLQELSLIHISGSLASFVVSLAQRIRVPSACIYGLAQPSPPWSSRAQFNMPRGLEPYRFGRRCAWGSRRPSVLGTLTREPAARKGGRISARSEATTAPVSRPRMRSARSAGTLQPEHTLPIFLRAISVCPVCSVLKNPECETRRPRGTRRDHGEMQTSTMQG